MDAFVFLKGLPAVLGIVGFFVYLWAGQYRIGGDLMKGVVDKLRAAQMSTSRITHRSRRRASVN